MSFHPITIGSKVFNQTGSGKYTLSTLTISDPGDHVVISAGSRNKAGDINAAITRNLYKDVTDSNGKVSRKFARVSLSVNVPSGFTTAEIVTLLGEINTFGTSGNLTRILLGEN